MSEKRANRKLTAILSADVKGYGRLMQDDETETVRTITAYREAISTIVEAFGGRVVDSTGDNLLAEFGSVIDAVECGTGIQQKLRVRNSELPENRRMEFRIGINLGDVIVDGDRIYGDGLNLAARLEGLAEAGGICISGTVHEQVRGKLSLQFDYLGLQQVKNIDEPVPVYRVKTAGGSPSSQIGESDADSVPTIAVLPFVNMSADPDQEYFCDGIAEDILNDLTHIEKLHVVARTSSFAFKGKNQDIREIGTRLGAQTMVEGSVRKSANRLRITAQLTDIANGYHLWSERYDREMDDIFAIQEEISRNIVQALEIQLNERERRALEKLTTHDAEAYDLYLKGHELFYRSRRSSFPQAIEMFSQAIQKDPSYALAYAGLADCHSFLFMFFDMKPENIERAIEASRKAIELDPDLAEAYASSGLAVSLSLRYDEAEAEFEKAEKLNPNLYEAYYFHARACKQQGKTAQSIPLFERASELRPEDFQSVALLAGAYREAGRLAEADDTARRAIDLTEQHLRLNPDDERALYLGSVTLVALGEVDQAIDWANRARSIDPEDPAILYNLACTYSLVGEIDLAVECFELAIRSGFASLDWIHSDLDLDPIRDHPRFQRAIERLR